VVIGLVSDSDSTNFFNQNNQNMIKQFLTPVFAFLLFASHVFGQCNPYYDFEEGEVIIHTNYNRKGKEEGSQKMSIKSVTTAGDKQETVADVTLYDKKGKEITTTEITMTCKDGVYRMNMNRFIPQNMEEMEGFSFNFEGDQMVMPSDLSVGQELEDARFTIKMETENPALSAMMKPTTTRVFNRKVEAKESITTPAGTFDCYKITYDTSVESKMMGMSRTFETSSIEWVAEDVGMVKVENYDKKGKMQGYTELTSFED